MKLFEWVAMRHQTFNCPTPWGEDFAHTVLTVAETGSAFFVPKCSALAEIHADPISGTIAFSQGGETLVATLSEEWQDETQSWQKVWKYQQT